MVGRSGPISDGAQLGFGLRLKNRLYHLNTNGRHYRLADIRRVKILVVKIAQGFYQGLPKSGLMSTPWVVCCPFTNE